MERPVFSPEFYRELALENPLGLTLHWREVEAWFNFIVWPAYKTYSYSRHRQSVRRWWSRCTTRDIERAREAMENVKFERAQSEQDDLPASDTEDTPNTATIHKIFGGSGD